MSISDWSSDVCSSDLSLRQQVREESLECERQLLAGTVDRMALGVIHLGADGSVLDMNGEARRILDARDGILLSPAGLSSESLQTPRDLHRLIELALTKSADSVPGRADAMQIVRPSRSSRLRVVVQPATGHAARGG